MSARPKPLHLSDHPAGVVAGTPLLDLASLPDHGGATVELSAGDYRLLLLVQRMDGEIYAYENRCPHVGTPLNLFDDRFLDQGGKRLICRTHGALFEPATGLCLRGPCKGAWLRPVAVRVEGDQLLAA